MNWASSSEVKGSSPGGKRPWLGCHASLLEEADEPLLKEADEPPDAVDVQLDGAWTYQFGEVSGYARACGAFLHRVFPSPFFGQQNNFVGYPSVCSDPQIGSGIQIPGLCKAFLARVAQLARAGAL